MPNRQAIANKLALLMVLPSGIALSLTCLAFVGQDVSLLQGQIHHYLAIAAGVVLVTLLLTILIGVRLQRMITRPILDLAAAMQQIKGDGDDSVQLQRPAADEIGILYDEFNEMLTRIARANAALHRAGDELQREAHRQMQEMQERLMEASRKASVAEVASNALHNVGNVLASVNVAACLIREAVRDSEVRDLSRVIEIVEEHSGDLSEFLSRDERGRHLPGYLIKVGRAMSAERETLLERIESLTRKIDHIKEIVSTQQAYAGKPQVEQLVVLEDLVDDALQISGGLLEGCQISVERQFDPLPPVQADRQRALLVLINLIVNAQHAVRDAEVDRGLIRLRIRRVGKDWFQLEVSDNGVGIAPEDLEQLFQHGFTTKPDGHGFGLHSAAQAAKEMGGSLSAHSGGRGRGARFILRLPLKLKAAEPVA